MRRLRPQALLRQLAAAEGGFGGSWIVRQLHVTPTDAVKMAGACSAAAAGGDAAAWDAASPADLDVSLVTWHLQALSSRSQRAGE